MKLTDGLFLDCARRMATSVSLMSPSAISSSTTPVCSSCLTPLKLDVLLLENLYGDIVSDLAAGLVGGSRRGSQELISVTITLLCSRGVHGSAPDIKGKNIANPTAIILAAVMMLKQHFGKGSR